MLARQIAIGFGIALIFPLLIYYAVCTFHPAPVRLAYFPVTPPLAANATADQRKTYADQQRKRQEAYDSAARDFSRILVLVSTLLGIAAILVGAFLTLQSIATGLILGGILTIAWGYWSFWPDFEDWVRFVSLLVGFAVLLLVGYGRLPLLRRTKPSNPQ
jgi:uncharacterized membrane protein YphA (DoxX/SURF4 family)